MATKEQVKGFFAPGKVPKSSDYINLIDLIPDEVSSGGLKQVDLATYAGNVGEIVEHVGQDINNIYGAIKYQHGFIYERVYDPSDTMESGKLYATEVRQLAEDKVHFNSITPTPLAETAPPYELVTWQAVYRFGYDTHDKVYNDKVISLNSTVSINDRVLVSQSATAWHLGIVTEANATEFDTDNTWGHGVGNFHYKIDNEGDLVYCPVFEDSEGNRFIDFFIQRKPDVSVDDYFQTWLATTGKWDSPAMLVPMDLVETTDTIISCTVTIIDPDVYQGDIYPRWIRVLPPKENFRSGVINLKQTDATTLADASSSWNGGQYDFIDIEDIVSATGLYDYNMVAVENGGITNGNLYIRTTANDQHFIITVPVGLAALFTKTADEFKYYPVLPAITITEYELSEMANNSGYGYGSDYGYGYAESETYGS